MSKPPYPKVLTQEDFSLKKQGRRTLTELKGQAHKDYEDYEDR